MNYYKYNFASTYGSGSYDTNNYNGSLTNTGTPSTTAGVPADNASSDKGVLSNTGFDITLAVTVACIIIFAALVIRFWKRPSKDKAAAPVDK